MELAFMGEVDAWNPSSLPNFCSESEKHRFNSPRKLD